MAERENPSPPTHCFINPQTQSVQLSSISSILAPLLSPLNLHSPIIWIISPRCLKNMVRIGQSFVGDRVMKERGPQIRTLPATAGSPPIRPKCPPWVQFPLCSMAKDLPVFATEGSWDIALGSEKVSLALSHWSISLDCLADQLLSNRRFWEPVSKAMGRKHDSQENSRPSIERCQVKESRATGMLGGVAAVNAWHFLKKIKHGITIWSSISTPRYRPQRIENRCSNKNSHTHVHNSVTPDSQEVETIQMSITDEQINKIWSFQITEYHLAIKRNCWHGPQHGWTLETWY